MTTATKNGKTKPANRVARKLAKPEQTVVKIQPLNIGKLTFKLRGTSPLVVHNFGDKSRKQMLEAQRSTNKAKKEPRCPTEEFLDAFYLLDGKLPLPKINDETKQKSYDEKQVAKFLKTATFGLPITGFKNAIIAACRNTDFTMSMMKQTLFLSGVEHHDWAIIQSKNPPIMDSRICRLAGAARTPIERFRPMWNDWETTINVQFDANQMSPDQVANLVSIAGFFVGVFEGRPERSSLGWGRFELVS